MALDLAPPLRKAVPADGRALAELVNFAGEGIPLWLWKRIAGPGEDPWAVGTARQAERAEAGQIVVVDEGAGVMAAMTGYPIEAPEPITDDIPPLIKALQELENLVVGTWYLNVLATYPRARGRGLGARLIAHGEAIAREAGLGAVSIIVADENHGARRLYERLGYREIESRDMVKEDWQSPSSQWILLKKDLT